VERCQGGLRVRAPRAEAEPPAAARRPARAQLAQLDPHVDVAGGPEPGRHLVGVAGHVRVAAVELVELPCVDGVAPDEQPARPQDPAQLG